MKAPVSSPPIAFSHPHLDTIAVQQIAHGIDITFQDFKFNTVTWRNGDLCAHNIKVVPYESRETAFGIHTEHAYKGLLSCQEEIEMRLKDLAKTIGEARDRGYPPEGLINLLESLL